MHSPIAWVGSKRRIIERLYPHIHKPEPGGRMIVPFFGSGSDSLYFHAQGLAVLASDANPDLVALVNSIEQAFDPALTEVTREKYVEIRERFNAGERTAANFLVLIRCSFNKLARYNRRGDFTAAPGLGPRSPVGSTIKVRLESEVVHRFAQVVAEIGGVQLCDYDEALDRARPGDAIYLDPPYFGADFDYTPGGFDHERFFARLERLRVPWSMSNDPLAASRFAGLPIVEVERAGTMSSDPARRSPVKEILVRSAHGWECHPRQFGLFA